MAGPKEKLPLPWVSWWYCCGGSSSRESVGEATTAALGREKEGIGNAEKAESAKLTLCLLSVVKLLIEADLKSSVVVLLRNVGA